MSRPIANTISYFSHDTDMSEDDKLEKVEFKYGLIGYAIYNKILERVYKTYGNFNIQSSEDFKMYGQKWRVEAEMLKEIVNYMREIFLFPSDNFVSNGVKKRMKKIKAERDRKRNYYKKKEVTKKVLDVQNTAKTPLKDVYKTDCSKQTKVNKSKLNKIKLKKIKEKNININNNSGKPEDDFIDQLFGLFLVEFKQARKEDYVVVSREKEKSSIVKLLGHYKNQNPEKDSRQTVVDFQTLFKQSLTVDDRFLQENISPSMILNKLNFIKTKLKGNNAGNNKTNGATTSQITGAVAKAFDLIKDPGDS